MKLRPDQLRGSNRRERKWRMHNVMQVQQLQFHDVTRDMTGFGLQTSDLRATFTLDRMHSRGSVVITRNRPRHAAVSNAAASHKPRALNVAAI